MTCPSSTPRRRSPTAAVLGLLLATALSSTALAQTATPPSPATPSAPVCSPTVSAALSTWDAGMAAAERFGDRAVALAREKGREYLLPLLGVDPKTVQPQAGSGTTDDLGKAVEDSRNSPERRAELCAAITAAVENARGTAGAGLDALKRALDDWRLMPSPAAPSPTTPSPAPSPSGSAPDGTIKT